MKGVGIDFKIKRLDFLFARTSNRLRLAIVPEVIERVVKLSSLVFKSS